MSRVSVYLVVLYSAIWIILTESLALWSIATGIALGVISVFLCNKFIVIERISNLNIWRLLLYIPYLIVQIYLAGFAAIGLIIKGARTEIVKIRTDIDNEYLRVILANSITLTPGTLTLGLSDDRLTVLWLREKSAKPEDISDAGTIIKGKLEKQLKKAQK